MDSSIWKALARLTCRRDRHAEIGTVWLETRNGSTRLSATDGKVGAIVHDPPCLSAGEDQAIPAQFLKRLPAGDYRLAESTGRLAGDRGIILEFSPRDERRYPWEDNLPRGHEATTAYTVLPVAQLRKVLDLVEAVSKANGRDPYVRIALNADDHAQPVLLETVGGTTRVEAYVCRAISKRKDDTA